MKKFEYETLMLDATGFWAGGKINEQELKARLNEMGQEGWELLEISTTNKGLGETRSILCVFKREL